MMFNATFNKKQFSYIVAVVHCGKYIKKIHKHQKQVEKRYFGGNCVYPAYSKSPKQLRNSKKDRKERRSHYFQLCPLSRTHYSVTGSYHLLFMNRVPGDYYQYTSRIQHTQNSRISYLYSNCNYCRINTFTLRP